MKGWSLKSNVHTTFSNLSNNLFFMPNLSNYIVIRTDIIKNSLEELLKVYQEKGFNVKEIIENLIWLGYIKEVKKTKKD